MKKLLLSLMAVVVLTGATYIPSYAQNSHTTTHRINRHHRKQERRIRRGRRDGSITRNEASQLHQEQQKVNAERHAAKADGVVTRDEKRQIRTDQKQSRRDIRHARHNAEKR